MGGMEAEIQLAPTVWRNHEGLKMAVSRAHPSAEVEIWEKSNVARIDTAGTSVFLERHPISTPDASLDSRHRTSYCSGWGGQATVNGTGHSAFFCVGPNTAS